MDDEAEDFGAKQGTWNALVRRARLDDFKRKAVALVVGSYADSDGTSVRCGVARVAVDCEMAYSTARRYLSWLREVGLIELVRAGNRKARRPDEYRLTIKPHTEKALGALTETEYRDLIDGLKTTNRAGQKVRRMRAEPDDESLSALTSWVSADARGDADPFSAHSRTERRNGYQRSPIGELQPKETRSPPTGGAPPPDPRRPEPPTASGSRLAAKREISAAHHPAQDLQGESLPHAGVVLDMFTREAI